jgi:hypothetical protein
MNKKYSIVVEFELSEEEVKESKRFDLICELVGIDGSITNIWAREYSIKGNQKGEKT